MSETPACALVAQYARIFRQHCESLATDVGGVALQQRLLGSLLAVEGHGAVPLVRKELHSLGVVNSQCQEKILKVLL